MNMRLFLSLKEADEILKQIVLITTLTVSENNSLVKTMIMKHWSA